MSVRYRDAGVDLDMAEEVSAGIKRRLGNTLFGGFLPVPELKSYDMPVLVSSIDGVGTKVRLAAKLDHFESLGEDIVHHCVNDIAVHGATPLLFLDYLAMHRLDTVMVERVVGGIAAACERLHIRLAGGETAEMPTVYPPGQMDLAGAVVGVVEQGAIVDGSATRAGDVVIGLPSSGLHSNGYSLVQQLFTDDDYERFVPVLGQRLGEALLEPHRCYLQDIQALLATSTVHAMAHITGGGIAGNLARVVPEGLTATVEVPSTPPLFAYLQERGVPRDEMLRVFNMGIGLIAVCDADVIGRMPESYRQLGYVEPGQRRVVIRDCN